MENGNQPHVFITDVIMDMTTPGQTNFDSWTTMPFFAFDANDDPVPGNGTMAVDDNWNVTVTVHYWGSDNNIIDALNNSTELANAATGPKYS